MKRILQGTKDLAKASMVDLWRGTMPQSEGKPPGSLAAVARVATWLREASFFYPLRKDTTTTPRTRRASHCAKGTREEVDKGVAGSLGSLQQAIFPKSFIQNTQSGMQAT